MHSVKKRNIPERDKRVIKIQLSNLAVPPEGTPIIIFFLFFFGCACALAAALISFQSQLNKKVIRQKSNRCPPSQKSLIALGGDSEPLSFRDTAGFHDGCSRTLAPHTRVCLFFLIQKSSYKEVIFSDLVKQICHI